MLSNAVKELQQRKNQFANQIASLRGEAKKIGEAIKALSKLSGVAAASVKPAKRKMSVAGRKAIAKAQKARWAKVNKAAAKAKPAKKRKMSAAARKKIATAMRARWAKWKAAKKK